MSHLRCLALLFAAAVAPAQTTASKADDPQLLLETVGPEGWRVRLGPTNLGGLLASDQGRSLWQPHVLPLLGYWQQSIGDVAAFALVRDRLFGYSGRVRVAVWLAAAAAGEPEVLQAAIVLEGDGTTELPALAADLRRLQQLLPGEWTKRGAGETAIDVCDQGPGLISAPLLGDKSLLIVAAPSDHFDAALQRGRTLAATSTGTAPSLKQPAFRLSIDLPTIIGLNRSPNDEDGERFMAAIGIPSLGRMVASIGSAGPLVQVEVDQEFVSDERGIFGALCSATAGVPGLTRLLEKSAGSWHVGRIDLTTVHDVVLTALSASFGESQEKMRQEMAKELGIDLRDDLLAHTSDEMMLQLAPLSGLDRASDATWTFALSLRDEAAFKTSLQTMLPKARPFLSREADVDVDGVELQRFGNMAGYDLWLAVGRGMFLLSGGRDAEEQLTALLRTAKSAPAEAPKSLPTSFEPIARHLPPGLNTIASCDIDALIGMPMDWWLDLVLELLPMRPGSPEPISPEDITKAREILRQHGLGTMRTTSGYAGRHWRWRLFW